MMSGQEIRHMSNEATRKAERARKRPYRITQEDLEQCKAPE